jgi:hypothetical protein
MVGNLDVIPIFDPLSVIGPSAYLSKALPMESAAVIVKIEVFIV